MHTLKEILTEPQTMYDGGLVEEPTIERWVSPNGSEMFIPIDIRTGKRLYEPPSGYKLENVESQRSGIDSSGGGIEAVAGDEPGDIPDFEPGPVDAAISYANANKGNTYQSQMDAVQEASSKFGVTIGQMADKAGKNAFATQAALGLMGALTGLPTGFASLVGAGIDSLGDLTKDEIEDINNVLELQATFMHPGFTAGLVGTNVSVEEAYEAIAEYGSLAVAGLGVTTAGPGGDYGLGAGPGDAGADPAGGLDNVGYDTSQDFSDHGEGTGGLDSLGRGGLVTHMPMYDGGLVSMQDGGDTRDSISKFLSRRHGSGLIREPGPKLPKPKPKPPTRTKSKAPKLPPPKPKTATRTTPQLPKPKPKLPTRAEAKAPKPKFKSTPEYDKMLAKVKQDLKDVIPYIKDNYLAQLGLELLPPERIIHLSKAYTDAGWYAPRNISYDEPGRGYKFTSRELENLGINPADILEDEEGNRLNVLTYGGIKPNRTESELFSIDTRKLKNPWEFESEKIGRNLTKEERQVRKLSTLAHELTHVGDVALSRFLGPDDDIEMDKDLGEYYTRLLDIRNRDRGLGKFSTNPLLESRAVWSGVKPRYPGDPFSTSVRKPKSPTNKRRLERLDPEDFEKAILNHPAQDAAKRMLESIRKRKQNKPMYDGGLV